MRPLLSGSGSRKQFSTSSASATTISDESTKYLRTIRDYIRFATSHLRSAKVAFGQGSTSATEDAMWLVLGSLNLPLHSADTDLFLDANLTPEEISTVMKNLRRRVEQRTPTGYITNRAVFGSYEFYVDERAIIPRSCSFSFPDPAL
jgi:ribosomal protein L3 glutamine methyltransferase